MYALPTKPQGIGAILDNGTRLLIAGIRPVAIMLVIMLLIDAVLFKLFGAGLSKFSNQLEKGQITNINPGDILSFMLPFMIVYFFFTNAMIAIFSAVANAKEMSLSEAFLIGARKLLAVIAYGILYNLILVITTLPAFILILLFQSQIVLAVLFGLLAMIPPAILGLTLYFGNYLIIIDNAGILESLVRSHKLVRGNLWRTSVYIFLIILIQFVSILLVPLAIALIIPFIHDLKLRKESGSFAA